MPKKKILVIGKNSYIGHYIIQYLTSIGADVLGVSSRQCDFLDNSQVANFFASLDQECSYAVIFLAVINKSVRNDFSAYLDNITIVNNFIEHHRLASIDSIIYFSSVDVYGIAPKLPITELTSIEPDSWYGLAKFNGEWMLQHSEQVVCPVTILRIPGIYGNSLHDKSIIKTLIMNAKSNAEITLTGDGSTLRDYVCLEDLARIIVELMRVKYSGIINVATGSSYSIREVAESIRSLLATDVTISFTSNLAERGNDQRSFDLVFDNTRLRQLLPAFQFVTLIQGFCSYQEQF